LGAILGGVCILAVIAALLIGAKPLVFRSGSMAPAIPTGALGLSVPIEAASIRTGDVISIENAAGVRITHRVVKADISEDMATVTLKGDANAIPDAAPYVLRETDRVVAHAPLLGYAVAWLSSSAAVFAGGLFTAYLLFVAFGAPRRRHSQPESPTSDDPPAGQHRVASRRSVAGHRAPDRTRRTTRMTAMAVASLIVLTGGSLHTATPSQAAFLDSAPATGHFTAVMPATPTLNCAQGILLSLLPDNGKVELSWVHNHSSTGPTGYEMTTQVGTGPESAPQPYGPTTTSLTLPASSIVPGGASAQVTIRIYSRYNSWTSLPGSTVASYVKPGLGGLVPATLTC
jgi:signal peptidase I